MPLNSYSNLNPNISVDCVIFGFDFQKLNVLLIERDQIINGDGDKKVYALPGDLIKDNEDLNNAAERNLKQLTGLENIYLQQFYTFGDPDRVKNQIDQAWLKTVRQHPEARVITVAYYSLIKLKDYKTHPASFARNTIWCPVHEIPDLAFDHNQIISKALKTLRFHLSTEPIGFELLPRKFTLSQLQRVYEAILGSSLDKRNFRKKLLNSDLLIPLNEKQKGVKHKPARLYSFDKIKFNQAKEKELNISLV